MIVGKKLNVRAFEKEDLKFTLKWANDPDITYFIGYDFPISMEEEIKWYERIMSDPNRQVFIVETKDGIPIGFGGYHDLDWKNSKCELDLQIGDKNYWNKGYGTDFVHTMLYHAFNVIGFNRVYGYVLDYTIGALKMDLKAGFNNEGVLKENVLINGKYHDQIIVGITKKEFNEKFNYTEQNTPPNNV